MQASHRSSRIMIGIVTRLTIYVAMTRAEASAPSHPYRPATTAAMAPEGIADSMTRISAARLERPRAEAPARAKTGLMMSLMPTMRKKSGRMGRRSMRWRRRRSFSAIVETCVLVAGGLR